MTQYYSDLLENGFTSVAAYANLVEGMTNEQFAERLTDADFQGPRFTNDQAIAFASRYQIATVINNANSGLYAVLFRDTANGGKLVLSIRGTEVSDANDLVNDAVIAIGGFPSQAANALLAAFDVLKASGTITDSETTGSGLAIQHF